MTTSIASTQTAHRRLYLTGNLAVWVAVVLLFTAAGATGQTEYPFVVDANLKPGILPCIFPSQPYNAIQLAVNAVPAGSTILVCPGNYPEQIVINKSLTLRGVTNIAADTGAAVITAPAAGLLNNFNGDGFGPVPAQVLVEAPNVSIINLAVDGTGATPLNDCSQGLVGIGFDTGSSGTLRRVALKNQNTPNGSGGYCGGGIGILSISTASITVQDSSVRNFDYFGLSAQGGSVVVKTTVFNGVLGVAPTAAHQVQVAGECVFVAATSIQISNNTLTNCGGADHFGMLVVSGQPVVPVVTGNTIVGGPGSTAGIVCIGACSGATFSGNTIAGTHFGLALAGVYPAPGSISGSYIQYNDISGTTVGISFFGSGNTVTYNTINDAAVGMSGSPGNTVNNNTFLNVTTPQ